jgi:preprotein translocase subunit SecF
MIPNIYKGDYRLLALFPLALIFAALFFIPNLEFGVDFRGGTLITLQLSEEMDSVALEEALFAEGLDAEVRAFEGSLGKMAEIEISQTDQMFEADNLKGEFNTLLEEVAFLEARSNDDSSAMQEYAQKKAQLDEQADRMFALAGSEEKAEDYPNLNQLKTKFSDAYLRVYSRHTERIMEIVDAHAQYSSHSIETVSPALSLHFIDQAGNVVLAAAVISVILVFIFFRAPIPSAAVLMGAFSDIVIALGAMSLFGIPLSLPSFAALLMLVGFSLDTDILLTMRILKRRGDPRENAFDAMKTGVTMSMSAIVAFSALFILALLTHIPTYYEISAVALAGLVGDLFATWGINAVMVLYYKETRG